MAELDLSKKLSPMKAVCPHVIRYLFMVVLMVFQSSVVAQNIKRPDSYNYTRGVEAIQFTTGAIP